MERMKGMEDRVTLLSEMGKFEGVGNIRFTEDKDQATIVLDDLSDVTAQDLLKDKPIRLIVSGPYYELYTALVQEFDSLNKSVSVYEIVNQEEQLNEDLKVEIEEQVNIVYINQGDIVSLDAITRDISAGGFCFASDQELDFDKKYEVVFNFFDEPLLVNFNIVRKIDRNMKNKKLYGCQFLDLSQHAEEEIRRKVFQIVAQKRRMRKQ